MASGSSVVVRLRESTRGAAGRATVLWSVAIAVSIFCIRAEINRTTFELVAVVSTILLGAYLGWHRRTGVILFAPAVSWLFGWFPLIIGEMVRDGFFKGLFIGMFLATFGWVVIGGVELLALLAVSIPFRLVTGIVHHDEIITIENPFKFN